MYPVENFKSGMLLCLMTPVQVNAIDYSPTLIRVTLQIMYCTLKIQQDHLTLPRKDKGKSIRQNFTEYHLSCSLSCSQLLIEVILIAFKESNANMIVWLTVSGKDRLCADTSNSKFSMRAIDLSPSL